MKINIQTKSPWLENLQNTSCDMVVRLIGEDGFSHPISASFLAASSQYLCSLLPPTCCSSTSTVIHLPSVSGSSLKLFSQILHEGETEQLSGKDVESCLENVEALLELLGCKVKLVTKLGCKKAPPGQIRVVSTESLAQDDIVKEEYKEFVEVFKNEDIIDFDSNLEVKGDVKVESSERGSLEKFVDLRPLVLQEEECGNSDSCDVNQNKLVKECEPLKSSTSGEPFNDKVQQQCSVCQKYFSSKKLFTEHCKHAHSVPEDTSSPSRWSKPQKVMSHRQGSSISDKNWFKNARREFQCILCDLGFFTSAGLERHTSDKHGDNYQNKEFRCLVCDISYFTKNSLDKHEYDKHGNGSKKEVANTSESTSTKTCDRFEGPFSCTVNLCDYSCNSLVRIVKHWNHNHTAVASEASFLDTATSTTVTLYQVFAFILQCRLCGIVRCSRHKMSKAVWSMTLHLNSHHSDRTGTGNLSSLYSVLQECLEITEPESEAKTVPSLKQRHESNKAVDKVPTVAELTSKQSFSKKGYTGPYHCLAEGCNFVCDKFGLTTQKLLVNHWSQYHGNVKPLIYLDMSSFTIINVKIICNNVGYCSYVGCHQLIFASRNSDFRTCVLNHWKKIHSSSSNSFTPNMCKTISDRHVPDINQEESVALAKRTNIRSKSWAHTDGTSISSGMMNEEEAVALAKRTNIRSKSWAHTDGTSISSGMINEEEAVGLAKRTNISSKSCSHDDGTSMSISILSEEEYLKMRRRIIDTSLKKVFEQDGRTSLKCDICGKKWVGNVSKDRRRAVRHMGLHLQVRIRCSLCGVSLKSADYSYIHKSKHCKNKSESCEGSVDKDRKHKNDKVDSPKDNKRHHAVISVGKLDKLSGKRVAESLGALINDDKVQKFGQERDICISDNITTEVKQIAEGSKNEGCFENTDDLYENVVIDDVSQEEYQDDSHKSKYFKCPLKCSTAFTIRSDLLIHLKNFHRFNQETLKKVIKINPQL